MVTAVASFCQVLVAIATPAYPVHEGQVSLGSVHLFPPNARLGAI